MAKHKIFVNKRTGGVVALCDNIIDNSPDLGVKIINRAADVEFNNDTKLWEIIAPDGTILGTDTRRDLAIKKEIELMNTRIRESLK